MAPSPIEAQLMASALGPVAGVDEAGRGACAGPITIAACILPEHPVPELEGLNDSKKLTAKRRRELFDEIKTHALAWSIIDISAQEIDEFGIQWANITGMRRAVYSLDISPGYVLTDAMYVDGLPCPHLPIIGGDAAASCISAASILAKHHRDMLMKELDSTYPGYGFAGHKGYGTKKHMDAVRQLGGCPEHRYSYSNVAAAHSEFQGNSERQ
ncbi:MAG: ribonuclease HII [Corynebacterium sp.]|nr:ribonuclease HII [Corynebacterium sp.]